MSSRGNHLVLFKYLPKSIIRIDQNKWFLISINISLPTKNNFMTIDSRTTTPQTKPPDIYPQQKPPRQKPPRQNPCQSKIFVFHFLKIIMVFQVHNLLIVQWLPVWLWLNDNAMFYKTVIEKK